MHYKTKTYLTSNMFQKFQLFLTHTHTHTRASVYNSLKKLHFSSTLLHSYIQLKSIYLLIKQHNSTYYWLLYISHNRITVNLISV